MASNLLKYFHYQKDTPGDDMELCFLRDNCKLEVDFVVLRDGRPLFPVECKIDVKAISKHLAWFADGLGDAPLVMFNGGSIRGDCLYPVGVISHKDVLTILPLGDTIERFDMSGSQLLAGLEGSALALLVEGDGCPFSERVSLGDFLRLRDCSSFFDRFFNSFRPLAGDVPDISVLSVAGHLYPENRIKRTLFARHSQVFQEKPVSGYRFS